MRGKWFGAVLVAISVVAYAGEREIRSLEDLRQRFGLTAYDSIPGYGDRLRRVKVAILDSGFGDPATIGEDLPEGLFKPVLAYDRAWLAKHPHLGPADEVVDINVKEKHGREMAQIVWGMTGMDRSRAPQFYLLNARTVFNLKRAVQYCIDNKVDIILFAQNYEEAGNFDGRGYANAIVSRATAAGILWINAAGNYGGRVFNGGVKFDEGKKEAGDDTWLDLGGKKELRILSRLDKNPVTISLAWNRVSESETTGTDRNLDLFLYDEFGTEVASSEKKQVLGVPGEVTKDDESLYPAERINFSLSRNRGGHYTVRVKARSGRFDATDKIRISVVPTRQPYFDATEGKLVESVEFPDATEGQEIMVPGDHPEVITVGDPTPLSAKGPTMDADRRSKPDLHLVTSQVEFTDGEGSAGTSNAAAMFTGIVAQMKAMRPKLTRAEILQYVSTKKPSEMFKPGESQGIHDLGVAVVRKRHEMIFDTIDRLFPNGKGENKSPVLLGGQYLKKGAYVIALDRSTNELARFWNSVPRDAENYQVYLYLARIRPGDFEVWAYARPKQRAADAAREKWETFLDKDPESFVEVRGARVREVDKTEKAIPVWTTPTPERLNKK